MCSTSGLEGFLHTQHLQLRAPKNDDINEIYRIANSPEILHLWAPNMPKMSIDTFTRMLHRRMSYRWEQFMVVEKLANRSIIGFGYCYNVNRSSELASLCIVFDVNTINTLWCLQAAYQFISYLLFEAGYRKLYAEVHAYHFQCAGLLERLGLFKEATLKAHQKWNGKYWDLWIYSITRENVMAICKDNPKLVERLSCKKQSN